MAKIYANLIKKGKITIDSVAERWKEDVLEILNS